MLDRHAHQESLRLGQFALDVLSFEPSRRYDADSDRLISYDNAEHEMLQVEKSCCPLHFWHAIHRARRSQSKKHVRYFLGTRL